MSNRQQRIKALFNSIVELESVEEQASYLDEHCPGDERLRAEVLGLVSHERQMGPFLENSTEKVLETMGMPGTEDFTTQQIGPYKIREQLGEGGMGIVYVAEQTEPVRRKVALKIIKPGMDSKEVIARFEAERQALATMSHPHIAKVLDGGTTEQGRPYFVMELVKGIPITKFCDERKLSLRERLQLFVTVCEAVQHAHLKGIIHRDLKPSNVLVELHDVKGVPKVIDFGIAKAINQQLTQQTIYTQFSQLVGTPLYMSPEQAELSGLDVDTRSDVYSLGVLLYELLTGVTPFDESTLSAVGLDEMRRIIREDEPDRPSQKVSTLEQELVSTISLKRQIAPRQLSLSIQRELDWIVMKAMEKDRERRYESASDLAQDIQRYLEDDSVEACPPSLRYRLGKYFRRHTTLLTTAALIFVTALIGTAVSLWYANQAITSATEASEALAEVKEQKLQVERERERSDTLLYAAEMKLASDAVLDGDIPSAAAYIARHRPDPGSTVPADFAWRYLNRLINFEPKWKTDLKSPIRCLRLSPNGEHLAIAALGGVIQISDPETGRATHRLSVPSEVNSVAWSPKGSRLIAAAADGIVRIWELIPLENQKDADETTTMTSLRFLSTSEGQSISIAAHDGEANDALFTPDGSRIVTCGDDALIQVWEPTTGEHLFSLEGHEREVEQLALSPDGTLLASASSDHLLGLWDLDRKLQIQSQHNPWQVARMVCCDFSSDGALVAGGDIQGNVVVLETSTGQTAHVEQVDGVESIAFLDNPLRLVTGDRGGAIQLWTVEYQPQMKLDVEHAPPGDRWYAHQGRVQSLLADNSRSTLFSGSRDGVVAAWDSGPRRLRWTTCQGGDLCFDESGQLIVCERELFVFDLDRRLMTDAILPSRDGWNRMAISKETSRVAVGNRHAIVVYDLRSHSEIGRWEFEGRDPYRLAISPDGKLVAVAWWDRREAIELLNVDSPKRIRNLPARQCSALQFSPDGSLLAVGEMDDLLIYELSSARPASHLRGHDSALNCASFSPDGKTIATVGSDRQLILWDVETGKLLKAVQAHRGGVYHVIFSGDGRTIVTSGNDSVIRLWQVESLQPILELPLPYSHGCKHLAFSPNGDRLVARSQHGGDILVFDAVGRVPHGDFPTKQSQLLSRNRRESGVAKLVTLGVHAWQPAVTNNGETVVGDVKVKGRLRPFRWTKSNGVELLPVPEGYDASISTTVSQNNEQVITRIRNRASGYWRVALWEMDNPLPLVLEPTDEFTSIYSNHVQAGIVAGYADLRTASGKHPWRLENDRFQRLPRPPNTNYAAIRRITTDGSTMIGVGWSGNSFLSSAKTRDAIVFCYREGRVEELLGFEKGYIWRPVDISADGRVIVGSRRREGTLNGGLLAFRWEKGHTQILETFTGSKIVSAANAVSADGQVIAGSCHENERNVAVVWDAVHGVRRLRDVAKSCGGRLEGWELLNVTSMSADGTWMTGPARHPDGRKEAYLLYLPAEAFPRVSVQSITNGASEADE